MSSNAKNWTILFGVGISTALYSWLFLDNLGHEPDNVRTLLRLTARIAFFVYVIVFVARPLRQLLPVDTSRWLLSERRSFGLAFGAIMTVHLGLILYRASIDPDFSVPFPGSIPGMIAYSLLLLMLITSFNTPARAFGPRRWRILHKTGLYYFGVLFLATLLPWSVDQLVSPERLWFSILTAAALLIRLTAYFAQRKKRL
ncbi:MAG: ferric reductase-like transmembrane domain-containing protein [Woeseiaceae bacterium]